MADASVTYPIFRREDLNGFWALFADNLANMIIASTICKYVFNMSDEVVFGHILPGLGVALIVGLAFYAYLARRLASREGRSDVTALPYGISTPILFVYLFGVIGPVYFATKDGLLAWRIGIAAACIGGVIEMLGSVVGPLIKRVTPRAGMLGTLAGIAVVWIATVPLAEIMEHPIVGFASLTIIVMGLVGGIRLPKNLPVGLVAIALGTIIALVMGQSKVSFEGTGLYVPVPVLGDLMAGFEALFSRPTLFMVIIPVEIYNFIETMNNVESAEAAGDKYNVRACQIMDGVGTLVGSVFGSPFPTTVYIGHPAYKRLNARAGYALGVGLVFFVGSLFGLVAFLHHLIPMAAVAPMLVFIGVVIAAQAFNVTPKRHAMAVAVAMVPHISDILVKKLGGMVRAIDRVHNQAEGALAALANEPTMLAQKATLSDKLIGDLLRNEYIHWAGQNALSQGAIVTGLLWGAIFAKMIDGKYHHSAYFALATGLLHLVGIIHRPALGLCPTSPLFYGYLIMAALFYLAHILKLEQDLEATL